MTVTTPMKDLYSRLGRIGIAKHFASKTLPSWWDDEIALSPSGFQQAQLYFARTFNIELRSLASEGVPRFYPAKHKFKLNRNVSEDEVSASANYATAIARLALLAIEQPYSPVSSDPNDLRKQILQKQPCVNLAGLLDHCASLGIPVIHIEKMPGKKMAGLAIRIDGRYAIVLSKKAHPAYLLFHLAHELGHIANGHLAQDGFLVDQKIGEGNRDDADENEADAYAIRLLNGAEIKYTAAPNLIRNGKQLYQSAESKAKATGVDVGHIILNYGHGQGNFQIAAAALKFIPGLSDGNVVVNGAFFRALNSGRLSEDQLELLQHATNYSAN
jgi:Zn-dependent peptidase ImmA (M78 family)